MLRSAESEHPRLTNSEIFSKNSNLCDHDTSVLQTDGQTDGWMTCHSNTVLCVALGLFDKMNNNMIVRAFKEIILRVNLEESVLDSVHVKTIQSVFA